MILLDANILLRALVIPLTPEDNQRHNVAANLLRQADQGDIEITTLESIIAEVAFVPTSKAHYRLSVEEAAGRISGILQLRGFKMQRRLTVLHALDLWSENPSLGCVDALLAAHAQESGYELASFDHDFDGIPGIARWSAA